MGRKKPPMFPWCQKVDGTFGALSGRTELINSRAKYSGQVSDRAPEGESRQSRFPGAGKWVGASARWR